LKRIGPPLRNLLRAGVTFRYTAQGPEGLVTGKKADIVAARGGIYSEGPMKTFDFQEPHLKQLLRFIGITDIETIAVEGVALGPDMAEKALAAAMAQVVMLAGSSATATSVAA
jgi:FMN-dependent NADH-azoreductase